MLSPPTAAVTCPQCGDPVDVSPAGESSRQVDDIVVRITGLATARCPRGHATTWPSGIAARVVQEVRDRLLRAAVRGRGRRRRAVCGACHTDLALLPRHTDTPVPFDHDGQVITVIVEAPMVRCGACGLEQLPKHVAAMVDQATAAALTAAAEGD